MLVGALESRTSWVAFVAATLPFWRIGARWCKQRTLLLCAWPGWPPFFEARSLLASGARLGREAMRIRQQNHQPQSSLQRVSPQKPFVPQLANGWAQLATGHPPEVQAKASDPQPCNVGGSCIACRCRIHEHDT